MKIVLIVILLLFALLVLIIISKLKINIHYYHGNDNDQLTINFRALFGLVRKNIRVPVIKVNPSSMSVDFQGKSQGENGKQEDIKKKKITPENIMNSIENYKDFLHRIHNARHIINNFLKKIVIHTFIWETAIGTRNAALTGKLTGMIWGVKGGLQNLLFQYFSVRCKPYCNVIPDFNRSISITDFHCILSVRVGYAILTAIKLFLHDRNSFLQLHKQGNQNKNESL